MTAPDRMPILLVGHGVPLDAIERTPCGAARTRPARASFMAFFLIASLACGGGSGQGSSEQSGPQGPDHGQGGAPGHGHDATMQHRFERAEDWARLFDDPGREAWQKPDEVVALLALSPGMTVVDVGAGTGYFLARLSRAVGPDGSVIATDIEPDMVRYMRERAARENLTNVQTLVPPADDVGVPAAAADRVLFVDVWHHIADRERYAARLVRALKPGGAVVIVDFELQSRRGPPGHKLPPKQVMAELRAGGLVAELATESLPDQYVVIGRRR